MKLFNHSQEQQQHLAELLRDTATKLLSVNFENPADDQQLIRHHAYQKGKLDLLQALLKDDFDVQQPTQE